VLHSVRHRVTLGKSIVSRRFRRKDSQISADLQNTDDTGFLIFTVKKDNSREKRFSQITQKRFEDQRKSADIISTNNWGKSKELISISQI
jgi:hypothetical protein